MKLNQFRLHCHELLNELAGCCSDVGDRIQAARHRLDSDRLKLLVVGEFSRGKSTFINALVGEPILPSRVNPTTATINVLTGAAPRQAIISYTDGRKRLIDLPASKVNKFLDDIVTTANQEAATIQTVNLSIPGRLEQIVADVVDTPGVNDLDQMREEITFRYLREADAVVVMLDAQQPVSESERIFLNDKVMGQDINRMLFVLNRIDEPVCVGETMDLPMLKEYARKRLVEMAGVASPEVHAISAKEVLRARHTGQLNEYVEPFEGFERRLVEFAAEQATSGRMKSHRDRVRKIAESAAEIIHAEERGAETRHEQAADALTQARTEQQRLGSLLEELQQRLVRLTSEIQERVTAQGHQTVAELRGRLTDYVQTCQSRENLDRFRSELAGQLRNFVQTIEHFGWQERMRAAKELETQFAEVLVPATTAIARRPSGNLTVPDDSNMERFQTRSIDAPPALEASDMMVGGMIGAALGLLFGGTVGAIGAAVGTMIARSGRRETQAENSVADERGRILTMLNHSCDELDGRVPLMAEQLASQQVELLGEEIRERAANRQFALARSLSAHEESVRLSDHERQEKVALLRSRLQRVKVIIEKCGQPVG
ncbi:MAG: dynamin family protein [Planctomycetaceae bacterium]